MKLLINLCSYDGIATHYCGVGTIIKRYIKSIIKYCSDSNVEYELNLYTAESFEKTLGYNKELEDYHRNIKNVNIYKVSNGSDGETNFGTLDNWKILSKNTALLINSIDVSKYDKVITLLHDTPYCNLVKEIKTADNHIVVWIPHSTVKIHGYSSDKLKSDYDLENRYLYEQGAVDYINKTENTFLGAIGNYIGNHMITEYNLDSSKIRYIFNGELLDEKTYFEENEENEKLIKEIEDNESIILSFARAEQYKNLESTMKLGKELGVKPVVIAQAYYKGQPIIEDYKKLAKLTDTKLFIDVPFSFPHYILENYKKKIILLVPSKKEIMGLIVNEVRKKNKKNVLIVANDIDGLNEQVNDGVDGLLVNLDNIKQSSNKIKKYFNENIMREMNIESQKTLDEKYNFNKNLCNFMNVLLEENYDRVIA